MSDFRGEQVKIGGGGYVTGIDIAPSGDMVCRTDGAGAYRWDGSRWVSVTNMNSLAAILLLGQQWGSGVIEICISPSAPLTFYMMFAGIGAGLSASSGFVLRSDDAGTTWAQVLSYDGTGGNANDSSRIMGPKLAIDPAASDVVYVGTPKNGVYVTTDGGCIWSQIPDSVIPFCATAHKGAFPGHPGMRFDPNSPLIQGRTSVIYMPSYGRGVYRSQDAGQTWLRLSGGPATVCRAKVGAGGTYFCAANDTPSGTAWKHKGGWTNITSHSGTTGGGSAIIPDPADATDMRILAANSGGSIAASTDGGLTYGKAIKCTRAAGDVPWLAFTNENFMSLGDMAFDANGDLIFAEGIGVWRTQFSWPGPAVIVWQSMTACIENMLVTSICCPPGRDALVTVLDRCGFGIGNPEAYLHYNHPDAIKSIRPGFQVDYATDDPNFVVLTNSGWCGTYGFFSDNGGLDGTWQPIPQMPPNIGTLSGFIAAASATNWVSGVNGKNPQVTFDGGNSWTEITTIGTAWNGHQVCADKTAVGTFYAWQIAGKTLYRSTDGGLTWEAQCHSLAAAFELISVPGSPGHLFAAAGNTGGSGQHPGPGHLEFSSDGGATWMQVGPGVVKEPASIAVGARECRWQPYLTIYYIGYNSGEYGVWQAQDFDPVAVTATWTKLSNSPKATMSRMIRVGASLDMFGLVYVAAMGNSLFYIA